MLALFVCTMVSATVNSACTERPILQSAEPTTLKDANGQTIYREMLPHKKAEEKKIELFWARPAGDGPWPVILFIHGHQEKDRNGGKGIAESSRLSQMVSRGYVATAISQPGYGNSDGPPDFCGPFTQDAVLQAIEFLRGKPFVKPDKVALYGVSRGAIVASMVAARDTRLAAVVLRSGIYDLSKTYPTGLSGMDVNIRQEAGTTPEAFQARSILYHVHKIKTPMLLLHGAKDDRAPVAQAEALAQKLKARGIPVRIRIFPDAGHGVPRDESFDEMNAFLIKHLR